MSVILDITIAPNIAGIPKTAIAVRSVDDIVIIPVNTTSPSAVTIALPICFLLFESVFTAGTIKSAILDTTIAPNIAGIPKTAIIERNIVDTVIIPVNTTSPSAGLIDLLILSLFFASILAAGTIWSTILDKRNAPNNAGKPVTAIVVRIRDDNNKLPTSKDIFLDTFVPFSISFLFFVSFWDKEINLSTTESMIFIPLDATFTHSDAQSNFHIALFNADARFLIFFATSIELCIVFLFFCNLLDIDSIEFAPINISLNFLIVSFLIILLTFLLIFDNAFTISGDALISLTIAFTFFLSIFKSSSAFLNNFVN